MWKPIVKWALVALAVVGCWAAVQQARRATDLPAFAQQQAITTQPGVPGDTVLVTYFSSDARCATCVRIERLTRESVARNFGPQLASGRVQLRTINLDGPGNAHYVEDYQLISKTVIVSDLAKGQEVRWENLQGVWTMQKNERAFEAYVVEAVRRHLESTT